MQVTQLLLVGVVALIMVGVATWWLIGLFRREPDETQTVAKWHGKITELHLDGSRGSSMSAFHRTARTMLRVDRRKGRPGNEASVGRLEIRLKTILAWVYSSRTVLTTSKRTIELSGGGFMDWPWTFVPPARRYDIIVDGERLGRFEISDREVIGRDANGTEIGRWLTGMRIGAILSGEEPVYAALRLPGLGSGKLRVPLRRALEYRWFDFENVPFLTDAEGETEAEIWLLAFITLSAQASLFLLARSPDGPRPINS